MITHIIPPNSSFDLNYRAIWPSEKLDSFMILLAAENSPRSFELSEISPVLILHNPMNTEYLSVMKRRRQRGLTTIVEYSDNFLSLPPWNPARSSYGTMKGKGLFKIFNLEADLVTTTSEGFREFLKLNLGIDARVLKNQLPKEPPPIPKKTRQICWGGSTGHMGDLRDFKDTLLEINKRFDFELCGDPMFKWVAPELNFIPNKPYNDYLEWLGSFKVGVIVLTDTEYNRCRSDIKAVEMLSRGVVPIMPDGIVYKGIPGLKYLNQTEIPSLIEKILKDDNLYTSLQEEGYRYVKKNRCDESERETFFNEIGTNSDETPVVGDNSPMPYGKLSSALQAISEAPESRVPLLDEYLSVYPDSLEGRLMLLQTLEGDSRYDDEWRIIDERYPFELRHLTHKHQDELISRLEKLSRSERKEVLSFLKQSILKVTDIDLLRRALKVFGSVHGAGIMFRLATELEKSGESEEAKKLYRQLYSLGLSFYPYLPEGFPNFALISCLVE